MQLIDFNKLEYKRIDYQETKEIIDNLTRKLKNSSNFSEFLKIFKEIINIQNEIEEMYDYADIRNMRDSKDSFFESEIDYWNKNKTLFDSLFNKFYSLVLSSPFKEELIPLVPKSFFLTIEYQLKLKKGEISELDVREKKLEKAYRQIIQGKVLYDNEEINLSRLTTYFKNPDREIRKKASDVYNDYFYSHHEELDKIMSDLINTRNEIAISLGFKSYLEYSLYKLRRFGYDYKNIKEFRDNIIEYILPLVRSIKEYKKEELGLSELAYYDNIFFKEPPKPLYKGRELLNKIGDSFKNIDDDLYELYIAMLENNYIDLENRDNKVNFGITNYLSKSALPTITGNYKDNYLDVLMTTHESGHAFQKYNASVMDKNYIISSLLKYPTMEIAEMFSHALEIIAIPYLNNIFQKSDYNKYALNVLINSIYQLPYICLVDEFQERIYTKEKVDSKYIHDTWLELARKYELLEENQGHVNLDNGGYFYHQNHIYLSPFYYIDYALSSFGALAIASKCEENLELFKQIGSVASYYPFSELIEKYAMPNPFDKEAVCELSHDLKDKLQRLLKK